MNRRSAVVVLAAMFAGPIVFAQQAAAPKLAGKPVLNAPIKTLGPGKWGFAYTAIDRLHNEGQSANNPALPPVSALRGFHFVFRNGDHKFRRIALLADGLFSDLAFADQNGDDPFDANAAWSTFTVGHAGEVSAIGGGKFDVPLGPKPAGNFTLVLRGFEFRRSDGSDANVRNFGIKLDGARNIAQVSLIDDQGTDFRAVENTLGATAILIGSGIPLPGLLESAAVADASRAVIRDNASTGGIPRMVDQYRGYRVAVQYAWIPSALVKHTRALAGTARVAPPLLSPIDALTGFEFTFDNSDHHILAIGANAMGVRGANHDGDRGVFRFEDNDVRDDPMRWTATYVTLDRGVLSAEEMAEMERVQAQAKQAAGLR